MPPSAGGRNSMPQTIADTFNSEQCNISPVQQKLHHIPAIMLDSDVEAGLAVLRPHSFADEASTSLDFERVSGLL